MLVRDSIADITLQQVLTRPKDFDVIATPNLNGDYISDALAAQVGGIGIAPGGNINYETGHAIFEATHGTAPKYADLDKVNPGSVILSGCMMLRYMGWGEAADGIEAALEKTIGQKRVTYDFERQMEGATVLKTSEFASAIIENLTDRRWRAPRRRRAGRAARRLREERLARANGPGLRPRRHRRARPHRKPPRAHHSIHELVDHVAYWEAVVLRRYLGPPKAERRGRGDWRPPAGFPRRVACGAWRKATRRVGEGRRRPRATRTWTARSPTSSGPRPLVEVLHGVAAHDAYHAGQIRLTRKLLRGR